MQESLQKTRSLYFRGAQKLLSLLDKDCHVSYKWTSWFRKWQNVKPLCKTAAALRAPWLKGKLVDSWRSCHTRRIEVPMRAPPLPRDFLYALVNFALSNGTSHFVFSWSKASKPYFARGNCYPFAQLPFQASPFVNASEHISVTSAWADANFGPI